MGHGMRIRNTEGGSLSKDVETSRSSMMESLRMERKVSSFDHHIFSFCRHFLINSFAFIGFSIRTHMQYHTFSTFFIIILLTCCNPKKMDAGNWCMKQEIWSMPSLRMYLFFSFLFQYIIWAL